MVTLEASEICYLSAKENEDFKYLKTIIQKSNKFAKQKISISLIGIDSESINQMVNKKSCSGIIISSELNPNYLSTLSCNPKLDSFFENVNAIWTESTSQQNLGIFFPKAMIFKTNNSEQKNINGRLITLFIKNLLNKNNFSNDSNFDLSNNEITQFGNALNEVLSGHEIGSKEIPVIFKMLSGKPDIIPNNNSCEFEGTTLSEAWNNVSLTNKAQESLKISENDTKGIIPTYFKNSDVFKTKKELICKGVNNLSEDELKNHLEILLKDQTNVTHSFEILLDLISHYSPPSYKQDNEILRRILISTDFQDELFENVKSEKIDLLKSLNILSLSRSYAPNFCLQLEKELQNQSLSILTQNQSSFTQDEKIDLIIKLSNQNLINNYFARNFIYKLKENNSTPNPQILELITMKLNLEGTDLENFVDEIINSKSISQETEQTFEKYKQNLSCYKSLFPNLNFSDGKEKLREQLLTSFRSNFCDNSIKNESKSDHFQEILNLIQGSKQTDEKILLDIIDHLSTLKKYDHTRFIKEESDFLLALLDHPSATRKVIEAVVKRINSYSDHLNNNNFWIVTKNGHDFRLSLCQKILEKPYANYRDYLNLNGFLKRHLDNEFNSELKISKATNTKLIKNSLISIKENRYNNVDQFEFEEFENFILSKSDQKKYQQLNLINDRVDFLLQLLEN